MKRVMHEFPGVVVAVVMSMGLTLGCGEAEPGAGDLGTVETTQASLLNTADQKWDTGTQCQVSLPGGGLPTNMHCCPTGYMMMGVHVGQNKYRCVAFSPPTSNPRFLDTGTQRNVGGTTMHTCPVNTVMVGMHAGLNRFACQQPAGGLFQDTEQRDFTSQLDGVHVCPTIQSQPSGNSFVLAMTGIHTGNNVLACANGP